MRLPRISRGLAITLALILCLGLTGVAAAHGLQNGQNGDSLLQLYLDKLAGLLGVERSKLESAMKDARKQALDDAVSQGIIDSDRASKLEQGMDEGKWPALWPALGWHGGKGNEWSVDLTDAIASTLGLTRQQLCEQVKNGKTLQELAAAKGLTLDQLKTGAIEAVGSKLDEAVAAGKVTRDEADEMLSKIEAVDLSKVLQPPRGQGDKRGFPGFFRGGAAGRGHPQGK